MNFPSVIDPNDLASALVNSKVTEAAPTAGMAFLKMSFETGEWTLGQDEDVTGEEVLINVASIKHGWILWSGGRPNKAMVTFNQDLPMPMDGIGADYPSEARSFEGATFDAGNALQFDTSSYGGRKGVDKLLSEVKTNAASGSEYLYPRVKLSSESYINAKRGGKPTFNPHFEVLEWLDRDGKSGQELTPTIEPPKRQRRKTAE